jgi:hypothetical protein
MSEAKRISKIGERQAQEAKEKRRKRRIVRKREAFKEKALEAVASNNYPRVGECEDLAVEMVLDPTEAEELIYIDRGAPVRIANPDARPRARVVSLRDDPIAKMAKLGRLGLNTARDVRLMAARKWQEFYDIAAGEHGLDPFGDVVDGGRVDDIAEGRLTAIKALGRASQTLGMRNENLIYNVLGARCSLEEFLKRAGLLEGSATARQKTIDAYMQVLRDCLDDLAIEFRFMVQGKGQRRPFDRFDFLSRFASKPRLYEAVRRTKTS